MSKKKKTRHHEAPVAPRADTHAPASAIVTVENVEHPVFLSGRSNDTGDECVFADGRILFLPRAAEPHNGTYRLVEPSPAFQEPFEVDDAGGDEDENPSDADADGENPGDAGDEGEA